MELLLPGQDVHGQLLEIIQVQLIHLVQHGGVLKERYLMLLHDLTDSVDVGLGLIVFYLQVFQSVAALFEKSKEPLFLLLVKILKLADHAGQHLADLPHILGAHVI